MFQLTFGVLALLIAAFIYQYVYKLRVTINFYKAQGVTILPGTERPFLGNLVEYGQYEKESKVSEEPLPTRTMWVYSKLLDNGTGYKPEEHKITLMNLFGTARLSFQDPVIVQELFTTQNKFMDKNYILD